MLQLQKIPKLLLRATTVMSVVVLFFVSLSNITFAQDITPPSTNITVTPSVPDGENGWYKTNVSVKLNSFDLESGVKDINWKIGNGSWQKKTFSGTTNLIVNSSFEQNSQGWAFHGVSSSGERSGQYGKFGSYSLKTTALSSELSYWSNKGGYATVEPLKTVRIGAWFKGLGIVGSGVSVKVHKLSGEGVDSVIYSFPAFVGSFDWKNVSADILLDDPNIYGIYFELALSGKGDIYWDGIYASYASEPPEITFSVSENGSFDISYYATDFLENEEFNKLFNLKIDSVSPTNWQNFTTTRSGNDHTLIAGIDVSDNASGLDKNSSEFQYSVLNTFLWGYFSNYSKCSGNFVNNGWLGLSTNFNNGDLAGKLTTPAVDYCNSNWVLCKGIRFKVTDMAGNESSKNICINGPWVKVVGGDTLSRASISMTAGAPENNSDGGVFSVGDLSNFSSSLFALPNYSLSYDSQKFNYAHLEEKLNPSQTVSSLPTSDGIFKTNGSFYVNSASIPSGYSTKGFKNVLFVNGDMYIQKDIIQAVVSGTVFVVKGNVYIDKAVSKVGGFFLVDGKFSTSYNGGFSNSGLEIKGGVKADHFELDRWLTAGQSQSNPAEKFMYDPKYWVDFKEVFGIVNVRWTET